MATPRCAAYRFFFPAALTDAQRFFCAALIRRLAAADIVCFRGVAAAPDGADVADVEERASSAPGSCAVEPGCRRAAQ